MFRRSAWTHLHALNGKAGTTRKTTFGQPRFWGPKFGPQNGGHITIFIMRGTILGSKIWTPKWSPPGVMFLEPARFPKTAPTSQQGFIGMLWLCLRPLCLPVALVVAASFPMGSTGEAALSATDFWSDFRTPFQGPQIDPFCCWMVAGSALCFGKEDQPRPRFVGLVIGVCVPLHETKKGSVVRSTISCVWPRRVASEEASNWMRMQ